MSIICQEIRWFVRIFISFPGFWVMNGVMGLGFFGSGFSFFGDWGCVVGDILLRDQNHIRLSNSLVDVDRAMPLT